LVFLHAHDVQALWGVGPATTRRLHDLGVRTVGDLAALPPATLARRLGKASGAHLAALARGEDPDPVRPDRAAKSIGHEETFSRDLTDPAELERNVLRMGESVATMLRGASTAARTITVKVKFTDFSLQTRSHTLERPITTGGAIGQVAAALLSGIDPGDGIRLLGVSASGLSSGSGDQLAFDLGDGTRAENQSALAREQSWQDVTAAVDAIRVARRSHRARGRPPADPVAVRVCVGQARGFAVGSHVHQRRGEVRTLAWHGRRRRRKAGRLEGRLEVEVVHGARGAQRAHGGGQRALLLLVQVGRHPRMEHDERFALADAGRHPVQVRHHVAPFEPWRLG